MTLGVRKMKLLGVATVAILALSASGCSSLPTVPDWVDPTTWFGSEEPAPEVGETPDLASVPDKPSTTTPDEQKETAESLESDRANAKYSAEALRGGTEPAAAPPSDAPPPVAAAEEVIPAASVAKPAPVKVAAVDRSITQDPTGEAVPGTLPPPPSGVPAIAAAAEPTPAAEPVQTAELPEAAPVKPKGKKTKPVVVAEATPAPVAAAQPEASVPRLPTAMIDPSDAELGFKPSSAPPLDASVSQFVAAPIIDRYRSTATNAGIVASGSHRTMIASATPARSKVHRRPHAPRPAVAVGGPSHMEGKVVANLDALGPAPEAPPMAYANVSGATAVVYFPRDAVALNADGRAQVRNAIAQFRAAGGQGYVRVVGHSSSRTANMSAQAHLALIFRKSQDRANAVARALINGGIPADRVLVEAVGDTQPVYYESMPKGEEGNRRAEIFVQ